MLNTTGKELVVNKPGKEPHPKKDEEAMSASMDSKKDNSKADIPSTSTETETMMTIDVSKSQKRKPEKQDKIVTKKIKVDRPSGRRSIEKTLGKEILL